MKVKYGSLIYSFLLQMQKTFFANSRGVAAVAQRET